jgi:plastocyanin
VKLQNTTVGRRALIVLMALPVCYFVAEGQQISKEDGVSGRQQSCSPVNTCGSAASPCVVDVKRRGGHSASAVPDIPGTKSGALFCIKAGTTVTWQSSSKSTGFVIDFGAASPFESQGTIIGGSDRPISVVAKQKGHYRYSVGACTPGTVYGMCGSTESELVVIGPDN